MLRNKLNKITLIISTDLLKLTFIKNTNLSLMFQTTKISMPTPPAD